jgi:hypothetical protein
MLAALGLDQALFDEPMGSARQRASDDGVRRTPPRFSTFHR